MPATALATLSWSWEQWRPAYDELRAAPPAAATLDAWMAEWTRVIGAQTTSWQGQELTPQLCRRPWT